MDRRHRLQRKLEEITGSRNVYYQPPDTLRMNYPAVVYSLQPPLVDHAGNMNYRDRDSYQLTVIDRNPDSPLREKVQALPYCRMTSTFIVEGLNHYIFELYF